MLSILTKHPRASGHTLNNLLFNTLDKIKFRLKHLPPLAMKHLTMYIKIT